MTYLLTYLINKSMTTVLINQPLVSPGSAKNFWWPHFESLPEPYFWNGLFPFGFSVMCSCIQEYSERLEKELLLTLFKHC